jgi:hypothetical protein
VRDSYATTLRTALIVTAALFTTPMLGGAQSGFVSLVDLETGDIVAFNRLWRPSGDLRNEVAAQETAEKLVSGLPP